MTFNHDVTMFRARGLASETDHLLRGVAASVIEGGYDFTQRGAIVDRVRGDVTRQRDAESLRRRIARMRLDRCDEPVVDPWAPTTSATQRSSPSASSTSAPGGPR